MARKLNKGKNPGETEPLNAAESYILGLLPWSEENTGRRRPYASTIGYCPRQNYMMAQPSDDMNTFDAASVAYMGFGIGYEDFLYKRMVASGKAFLTNPYLPMLEGEWEDLDIGGRIDIVGWDHNDELAIWEVKTCGKLPTEPKLNHLRQLQTYSIFGGFDNAYLIYQSRDVKDWRANELKMKVFEIDTSEEALMEVTAQIFYTFDALDGEWWPDKPHYFRKTTTCRFCAFKDICWGEEQPPAPSLDVEQNIEALERAQERAERYWRDRPLALKTFLEYNLKRGNVPPPHDERVSALL